VVDSFSGGGGSGVVDAGVGETIERIQL